MGLDASIFAHAQEDEAVDGLADGVVQVADREAGVPQGAWPPGVFSEDVAQARKIILKRREQEEN